MNVSVIGLGKLGAPMAAVFAAKGHRVIGIDVNPAYVAALEAGRAPVEEPQLQEMIDAARGRLRVTTDYVKLVNESDISFIIVPTPSGTDGAFSNDYVLAAVKGIGEALRSKPTYHVVVVTSTVMPGATGGPILEALEGASGRQVGVDLGLCYNPEFIALGSVIENMLKPDFLLIGESDERAGSIVASVYESVCENHPPARRMNFVNAELAKISVNTFVTTKISYANMLADICDRLPGADVDVVAEAIGSDSRIGKKYLRGATGYGGPCFPRDNVAFSALAERVGAHSDIARATHELNGYQITRLADAVTSRCARGARVAVLGMSYKPNTPVVEESQGIMLARSLREKGYEVIIHDPMALDAARRGLGDDFRYVENLGQALRNADVAVVTTPWPEYKKLADAIPARRMIVIDCWRLLPRDANASIELVWLGYGDAAAITSNV
jgi:UDPglucose 6-dehydrogenase